MIRRRDSGPVFHGGTERSHSRRTRLAVLLAAGLAGTSLTIVTGGAQAYAAPGGRVVSASAAPPGVTTSDLQNSDSGVFNDAVGRTATFTFAPNGATGITRYQYA